MFCSNEICYLNKLPENKTFVKNVAKNVKKSEIFVMPHSRQKIFQLSLVDDIKICSIYFTEASHAIATLQLS